MATEVKLEKDLVAGTLYRAEADKYYVIEEVGTNSTLNPSTLEIDGKRCLEILNTFAPLKKTNSNLLGTFPLKGLPLIVPPNKTILFTGSSGSVLKIKGRLGILGTGEVMGGDYPRIFANQHVKYYTYLLSVYSFSDNTAVPAGTKIRVVDWTCPVGEKYVFDRYLGAEAWVSDNSASGDLSFEIFVEGVGKDILETTMGPKGYAAGSAPYPPRADVNQVPFIPENLGLEFVPGRTLWIDCTNAAALPAPGAGKSWQYRVILVGTKELTTI